MTGLWHERRSMAVAWWQGLTTRERWLVGTLAGLVIASLLIFGIIRPIQASRAEALADIRTSETLAARVRAAGTLAPQGARPQMRAGTPVEAAGAAAREAGLSVAFDGMTGRVVQAPYEAVIGWIAEVERTTPLRVRRAEMSKGNAAGRVDAVVEFGQ